MMNRPFAGIRVVEGALQYPGPYCGMLLAQLGAEVVKLETPGAGDAARHLPGFFNSINCSKKSITLNLKTPQAREILHRLIPSFDVFTEGFRPGVGKRLGIDYPTLSGIHPGLVYCSITGYGQDGPYHHLPGHDLNYQAVSGMLDGCFKDPVGGYIQPGIALGDVTAGLFAALSIAAAIARRNTDGKGCYIDVSMTDGLVSLLSTHIGTFQDTGTTRRTRDAGYGIYKTGDGSYIALGIAHEDWFWDRLAAALDLPDLVGIAGMKRREKRGQLAERLQGAFLEKPRDELLRILENADIPASPINSVAGALEDPHLNERQMFLELLSPAGSAMKGLNYPAKFQDTTLYEPAPPPGLGQHNENILQKLGYSEDDIAGFKDNGVI